MSKVLIIGAGGVGRVTTVKCAQHPDVFSGIMLASRTKSKCDVIAADIRAKGYKNIETAAKLGIQTWHLTNREDLYDLH